MRPIGWVRLSPMVWPWVIAIAVVVLGGSQIPKWARNLGRAQGEFKKGLEEGASLAAKDEAQPIDSPHAPTSEQPGSNPPA